MEPMTGARTLATESVRAAIVHEWLTIPGGSENVVLAILDLLQEAEIFTSVYDPAPWPAAITARPVHTSFLNRMPGARRHYTRLVPLMDLAMRRFDLDGFDLVVSSNHACAKNVRVPEGVPHICYCHTPMRYAWDPSFLAGERMGRLARVLAPAGSAWLRRVDRRRAQGPDVILANSSFVAERISASWGRESEVVHPPVDVERLLPIERDPGDAYLFFGRLVPYKRADLAVQACERLGRRLIVAGEGRDLDRVRSLASGRVEFLGHVPDAEVPRLLSRARALLFPGIEDFGIVPVEAQAAGVPVIAHGTGGVRDSVLDGETGVLYEPGTVAGLCAAIERFESLAFDESAIRGNAKRFSRERFTAEFGGVLARVDAGAATASRRPEAATPAPAGGATR
jgi:glycosyltransferase involved in cell wall biosynthesis